MTSLTGIDGDVFRRASEIMRQQGHCKGELKDEAGRVCALGAVNEALKEIGIFGQWRAYWELANEAFATTNESVPQPVSVWNDEPDRTQTEVEKFLLHCADVADFAQAGA